eukprot:316553_1
MKPSLSTRGGISDGIPLINSLEAICLICLISVLHLVMVDINDKYSIFLLNGLLILPLIIFLIQFIFIRGPYNIDEIHSTAPNNDKPDIIPVYELDSDDENDDD